MLKHSTVKKNTVLYVQDLLYGRKAVSPIVYNAACLFFGILIARAPLNGKCWFAGVSYIGSLGGGLRGAMGFLGICVGYISAFGMYESLLFLSAALFTYTIAFIFQYTSLYRSRSFIPCTVLICLAIVHTFGQVNVTRLNIDLMPDWILEAFFGAGLSLVYSGFFGKEQYMNQGPQGFYSAGALVATALMGVPNVSAWYGFSPVCMIFNLITMLSLYQGKWQVYPLTVMFGAALQLGAASREDALLYFPLYALMSIFLKQPSKISVIMCTLPICTIHIFANDGSAGAFAQITEYFCAVILLLCIPKSLYIGERGGREDAYRSLISDVRSLSLLLRTLPEPIDRPKNNSILDKRGLEQIFERAIEQSCNGCEHRCFHGPAFSSAAEGICKRGRLVLNDIPISVRTKCSHTDCLLMAVNYELRRAFERQRTEELQRQRISFEENTYQLFSQALDHIVRRQFAQGNDTNEETYSAEIGVASKKIRGESVCGDSTTYFKTNDGKLYIILSDGVGCGETAHTYSQTVIGLLERNLRVLGDPRMAISFVNQALVLRGNDGLGYATIDLLEIDLHSGEAAIFKVGASDSYSISKGGLSILKGNSDILGGLGGEFFIASEKIRLTDEHILIMASDGAVLDENALMKRYAKSMKSFSKELLLTSPNEIYDDKTVIAVRLYKHGDNV